MKPVKTPEEIILELVKSHTNGLRALFVSNRIDVELETKLTKMLGLKITWCEGSPRQVQSQCERIAKGNYDIVLSATGFQTHGVDGALCKAAKTRRVKYVRVNRGRPSACVQAIARDLGLVTA